MTSQRPALRRVLGVPGAVVIGLGSMIGAGVFVAFTPAARAAGAWLLVGLAIAAVVAFCNATASAQLAAQYPSSGGTYVYGRERLGPWWGFIAGWSFVIGKTASCAAMALAFAVYVAPEDWERPIAALAIVALTAVNLRGITRTAALATVLVVGSIIALALVVASTVSSGGPGVDSIEFTTPDWYGVAQSASLMFFAFAGYARIATLGEEVREPGRTIPLAISIALAAVVVIYAAIGVSLLVALGPAGIAASDAPLEAAVRANGWPVLVPLVQLGAALAALGALLALIAGIGRTTLAMAREGDLPRGLAAVHPRFAVPHRAELVLAAVVVVLVLTLDVRGAIGFSSFGVLLYYFVANVAAFTQSSEHRRYPRALQVLGAAGCLLLAATVPCQSLLAGVGVLAVGVLLRVLLWRVPRARAGTTA